MEDEKIIAVESEESTNASETEEYGRCRVYADRDVVSCREKNSESSCASYAREFIYEDGKDRDGRTIAYGWAPGHEC